MKDRLPVLHTCEILTFPNSREWMSHPHEWVIGCKVVLATVIRDSSMMLIHKVICPLLSSKLVGPCVGRMVLCAEFISPSRGLYNKEGFRKMLMS